MFGTVCGNNVAPATLQLFYQYAPTNLWTGKYLTFAIHEPYFRM